ncbi:MAG TPA: hypothetical protein VGH38_22955, partial [Bryobacteraceae bacterium]
MEDPAERNDSFSRDSIFRRAPIPKGTKAPPTPGPMKMGDLTGFATMVIDPSEPVADSLGSITIVANPVKSP